MSWIDYYVLVIGIWIFILASMLIFNKTRFFSFSLILSTCIFFVGLKITENIFPNSNEFYKESKKTSFLKASKKNDQLALNIVPASWLQRIDGRGQNSIIPMKYREQIGGFLPLGSAPDVVTFSCSEDEGFIFFKSDRFGFRNNDKFWENKIHDILILGDSHAESACVKKSIQEYFDPSVKIVTLGKGGNGPLTSLAVMTEYLEVYSPKIIYLLIHPNDYAVPMNHIYDIDLKREWADDQLQKYLNNIEFNIKYFKYLNLSLLKKFAIDYSNEKVNENSFENIKLKRRIANIFSYNFLKTYLQPLSSMNELSKFISSEIEYVDKNKLIKVYQSMIIRAKRKNTQIKFVLLPQKTLCSNSIINKFIIEISNEIKMNVLDFTNKLCDPKIFAIRGSHLNSNGYQKLSQM
ncbi:hypothetical protein OA180_00005, partial [Candidatus Pelagibacter sp.]|nr:hypothetical protein [Candidatus Pelagibacter sp.]